MLVRYLARRLFHSVFVIAGVVLVVFLVMHMIGDPARLMLRPEASQEQYLALRRQLGLDDPLYVQLGRFLSGLAHGEFGDSLWQRVPALPLVLQRLPATLYLTAVTVIIALPTAVVLGVLAALKPRAVTDRIITVLSLGGVSTADFWLGLTLILVFAVQLDWLPTSGYGGPQFVILPALTLAFRPVGRISQLTRSTMLDELSKAYVTTARAKGIPERLVLFYHTLRNAAIPIITLAADEMAALLNGAVVIETVFAWPGIGILLIQAIEHRDFPVVEAEVFVIALMVVALNLIVDLSYSVIDPRVRYS
ncbi:MAG: ABC transporter permease [Chloroflexi bacterium]|nr:ABC transporter permease [Chloroflexota bacterium]